ncbi:hypothetical protein D3C84_980440 [compost metagenome]
MVVSGTGEIRLRRVDWQTEHIRAVVVRGHVVFAAAGADHDFMGTTKRLNWTIGEHIVGRLDFIVARLPSGIRQRAVVT